MSDLRSAVRSFKTQPWSTAAIVITLGIGIGASTTVIAVVNHALLRPVPGIAASDRLVRVTVEVPVDRPGSSGQLMTIGAPVAHLVAARAMPAFESLAGYVEPPSTPVRLGAGADAELIDVISVTRDYFEVLGVQAVVGRLFGPDEYETTGTLLAVISERLWQARFAARPDVLGSTIHVGGRLFTVVGVARRFRGLSRVGDQDIWVPFGAGGLTGTTAGRPLASVNTLIGRLSAGSSLTQATAQVIAAFDQAGPIRRGGTGATPRVIAGLPSMSATAEAGLRTTLWFGLAGALMLLSLACANAASQLISRNLTRQRELGVRAALGASRSRLFRELLTEVSIISLCSVAVGVVFAGGLRAAVATLELRGTVPLANVALDWRVTASAVVIAVITILLAGVAPSMAAVRADPLVILRNVGRGTTSAGGSRQVLVAVQLAVLVVLVACAGLLSQSMARLHAVDLGFSADGLLTLADFIRPGSVGREADAARRFHVELQRRLNEVPGIHAAAYSGGSPLGGVTASALVAVSANAPLSGSVPVREVSSDYFRTMGIPFRAGRDFTLTEATGRSLGQVIIDELLATQLFGSAPAVGRRIWMEPTWLPPGARPSAEVIGVVGSTVVKDIRAGHQAIVYVPAGDRTTAVHQIRTSMPADQAIAAWRRSVRDMEPLLVVGQIVTPRQRLDQIAVDNVIVTRVSYVFASLAMLLALAGAYAVTARTVFERRRECGIRIALGASSMTIARDVLSRSLSNAILGLAVGAAMYVGLYRFLESWMFGISARDPLTLSLACLAMAAVTLAAAWLPAMRAMRVDPCILLRAE